MPPFEQLLPGFIQSCERLHGLLLPVSLVLLTLAFAFVFWPGPPTPMVWIKFLVQLFIILLLITRAHGLLNAAQAGLQQWVETHIQARPENIAKLYQEKLNASHRANDADAKRGAGLIQIVVGSGLFEAIIYAALTLISWFAVGLLYLLGIAQKVLLFLGWAVSPVLFACFALPPLAHLAWRHLLRLLALVAWPLAFALAATVTEGLIGVLTDPALLNLGVAGSVGHGLQSLLALALVGLWIIGSSLAGPVCLHRLLGAPDGAARWVQHAAHTAFETGFARLARSTAFSNARNYMRPTNPSPTPPAFDSPEPPAATQLTFPALAPGDPLGEHQVQTTLQKAHRNEPEVS